MSKPKPKTKRAPHPPSLNAIYRQQLLLRDAVKALTQMLAETQARCEKLQFDKGVLAERVLKAKAAARVPTIQPTLIREEDNYVVQCRCGWMGKVSTLKPLGNFKLGCPTCSSEFKVCIEKLP